MKKFKKLIIFSLLFLLTGCNNQVNEIEVTSTKLDLPFFGEKYSYLDYVFKEDSENHYSLNLPLKFDKEISKEQISKLYYLDNSNNEVEGTINDLTLLDNEKYFYNLNVNFNEKIDGSSIFIELNNNSKYEIPLNLSYIEESSNTYEKGISFKAFDVNVVEHNYAYEFKFTYSLVSQNSITLTGINDSLTNSIFKDSEITIFNLENGDITLTDTSSNIYLKEGSYILEVNLLEDGYTYFLNNNISFNFKDGNNLTYSLLLENEDELISKLYLTTYNLYNF